ncbi:hypothetical protein GCM10027022_00660 [Alpinimonas psychrophila]|uniref:Large-conductance mechanosensitive channel n=1 Tax=Alpinimonas psychrophila TaxID=748908 RepID=A0A7W3PQ03_9MICO|nr:DUF4190 domain-containing protein [Alpinimonas psychrophila]MBA8829933.1 large-conductance mechanosensitive channel [Alpinimonas psychrophila]MBA8830072.1 large-conductance mechanosensitive channel [Alpinimonas psychrophila]
MSENNTAQPVYVVPPAGAKTNMLAIVSLVTSIIGLGIVGIITGHLGLSQIRKTGEQGSALAIAGLIIGYLEVIAVVIFIIIFFVMFAIAGNHSYRMSY